MHSDVHCSCYGCYYLCHLNSLLRDGYYDNPPLSHVRKLSLRESLYVTQGCTLGNGRAGLEPGLASHLKSSSFLGMLLCVAVCSYVQVTLGQPPDGEVIGQIGA